MIDIILRILAGMAVLGAAFLMVLKLAMWMYAFDWDGKKSWDDADADTREDYMSNAFCTICGLLALLVLAYALGNVSREAWKWLQG